MTHEPARLCAKGIRVGYGERLVLDGLDLCVPTGVVTGIIGSNGCGKSTLLKALGRLIPVRSGAVTLDGVPLPDLSSRELATVIGLLPQSPVAPDGLLVHDLVSLGRHPHRSWVRQWASDDDQAVRDALELTGVADLADRPVDSLSGGQRQRVWISMVLAQQTPILLLDEPTTFLDLAHSLELLDLVDSLHADHGRSVVMVLHDLVLASRYCDHLVVMADGRIAAQGHPREVLSEELLLDVFHLKSRLVEDPVSHQPLVVPVGNRHVERLQEHV